MSNLAPKPTLRARVAAAILEAAAGVLAAREQASMGDVAEAAGVARATLYRYFPTREALLDELGRFALEQTGDQLEAANLDGVPVADAFERAVRTLVGVGDYFVVLARERPEAEEGNFDRRVVGPLRTLIGRGQAEGQIRDDVPASWLIESLLSLVVSVLPSAPSLGPEDTVHAITSLFLHGAHGPGADQED
jgi:TetR/AcrR family transcriptional regulator, mexCD-oprJ operon repressor